VDGATAVLNEVARSNDEAVGFFVQFADPDNANFRLIAEIGLTIIPVISNEILDILRWDGQPVYQQKTFETKSGGVFDILDIFARQVTTACTPLTIITGKPDEFGSGEDQVNQRDLTKKISEVSKNLLQQQSRTVAIIMNLKKLAMRAIEEAGALVERLRQRVEKSQQIVEIAAALVTARPTGVNRGSQGAQVSESNAFGCAALANANRISVN
jgi:hypothetical protein